MFLQAVTFAALQNARAVKVVIVSLSTLKAIGLISKLDLKDSVIFIITKFQYGCWPIEKAWN
jgi:hypothetical protein